MATPPSLARTDAPGARTAVLPDWDGPGLRTWAGGWVGVLIVGLGCYAAAFIAWVGFGWGGDRARLAIGDLSFLPVSLAAAALALRVARVAPETRSRIAWRLVAAAFAAMLAGDALWSYVELVRHEEPFPSIADPFYLVFYPLMLAGVLLLPVVTRRRGERMKFALDSAAVLFGGGLAVWHFVLRPTAVAADAGALSTVLSLAYPIGDLVLICAIASVLMRRPEWSSRASLWILAVGLAAFVVGDFAYGYLSLKDEYASGDWPDAAWMLAQYLMVLAAHAEFVTERGASSSGAGDGHLADQDRRTADSAEEAHV